MTEQENKKIGHKRLINIGYFGGSHGAFLKFFIDKFSKKTPDIITSPFLDNGTSHNLEVKYSGRIYRYTFEDTKGIPRNNYKLEHKGEPQIVVTLDEPSQMNYLRLHFTRESDHELVSFKFDELDSKILVSNNFIDMYADKFKNLYNIDLKLTKLLPYAIMRDFIKMHFVDSSQNKALVGSKKTMQDADADTIFISLSEIWDTDLFMQKMNTISKRFNLQLVLDDSAVNLHREFLRRRVNHATWNRVYTIIDDIKEQKDTDCSDLDIVEQGYLYAWLEKTYDFVQAPLTRKFFDTTAEILEYVTHYPNHYKAMNPNLPVFNNIANPFYLWHKNRDKEKQ